MLNIVWLLMVLVAVVTGILTGHVSEVAISAIQSARLAFSLALDITGIMCLWLGVIHIAEKAGMLQGLTRLMLPLLRRLFPDVPRDHPAMHAISMNFSANLLGLNNAALPFGLRAMEELNQLNPVAGTATNAMCTFVTLHSSNFQLVPATVIALMVASGATHPADIVLPVLLGSACAVIAAVLLSRFLEMLPWFRYPSAADDSA